MQSEVLRDKVGWLGMARDEEEGEDDQDEGQEEDRRCWGRKA